MVDQDGRMVNPIFLPAGTSCGPWKRGAGLFGKAAEWVRPWRTILFVNLPQPGGARFFPRTDQTRRAHHGEAVGTRPSDISRFSVALRQTCPRDGFRFILTAGSLEKSGLWLPERVCTRAIPRAAIKAGAIVFNLWRRVDARCSDRSGNDVDQMPRDQRRRDR